jgi:hypothetical protein
MWTVICVRARHTTLSTRAQSSLHCSGFGVTLNFQLVTYMVTSREMTILLDNVLVPNEAIQEQHITTAALLCDRQVHVLVSQIGLFF